MPLWGSSSSNAPQPPTFGTSTNNHTSMDAATLQSKQESDRNIKMAVYELRGITDIFNRLTQTCWDKCIAQNKFNDTELTVGELACDDRCVIKYLATMVWIRNNTK